MLCLEVLAYPDKSLEVSGAILTGGSENDGGGLGALEPTRTLSGSDEDDISGDGLDMQARRGTFPVFGRKVAADISGYRVEVHVQGASGWKPDPHVSGRRAAFEISTLVVVDLEVASLGGDR